MTKKELLIRFIGLSGEMPADLAVSLVGSASYAASLITDLKKDGYIAVRSRDGIKGYVLHAKGKKFLLQNHADDFSLYVTGSVGTGHVRSEPQRRLRLHRMSMTWVFFYQLGIRIFITEKPSYPPVAGEPGYYGSAEMRKATIQVSGSRACGVLCTGEIPFVVYHTMGKLMKWSKKTERSMRSFVEGSMIGNRYACRADAIVIGNSMDVLLLLLKSDGGLKGSLFQPDDIYDHYYFFPMNEDCRAQMKLVTDSKAEEDFRELLGDMLFRRETKKYALADGFDQTGRTVYFFYKLDLMRLIRIKQEMIWRGAGVAYCFDYQADILREYFGLEMELQPIVNTKAWQFLSSFEAGE